MPCSTDISFDIPDGPSGPSIPGFGTPYSLKLPNINPFPEGFPEDLLELLDKVAMLLPTGLLKPALNPNFGKDIFDSIMKVLDMFMPYLMLYKFFLPILKLIICIIEVLCALKNPFKLIRAIKRLFRKCLPEFLNLFPIFAIIIMLISLLQLLLALIEYIINKILALIELILRNLRALYKAMTIANENSILAIAKKLGAALCIFQNLFVLLAIFNILFDIIRDILSMIFSIPPCDDSNPTDSDGCCTPDVCPAIVKSEYTRQTGNLQYFNKVSTQTNIAIPGTFFSITNREESWQLYDVNQTIVEAFYNIVDAHDIPQVDENGNVINTPKPIFFPTDATYNAQMDPRQAAYTVDLRIFYDPTNWGRPYYEAGFPRYILFKNCIVLRQPSKNLSLYDNSTTNINNGVFTIAGGAGFEDDGTTRLIAYESDGITRKTDDTQASLNTFLHRAEYVDPAPVLYPFDGYSYNNIQYTFKPNQQVLMDKGLITSGCIPSIDLDKTFVNNVLYGDINVKLPQLQAAVLVQNGFPDPNAAQECLAVAVANLRNNFTVEGVAQFKATTDICLNKLKEDTSNTLGKLVEIGFEACKSRLSLNTNQQFTSKPIIVSVNLNEKNGLPIASNLSAPIANNIAAKLKPYITFGNIGKFTYDGYQVFTAELTSKESGEGSIMVAFNDNIFCTDNLPENIDEAPSRVFQELSYKFVYTLAGIIPPGVSVSTGDTDGQPRRDESDMARDSGRR